MSFFASLCLKGQDFDMGLKQEINYAPYLRFRQRLVVVLCCCFVFCQQWHFFNGFLMSLYSRTSVMDDTVEEHKLLAQQSDKARLRELAGDEWVEGKVDEFISEEEKLQTCDELREVVKTERDQKVIFHL